MAACELLWRAVCDSDVEFGGVPEFCIAELRGSPREVRADVADLGAVPVRARFRFTQRALEVSAWRAQGQRWRRRALRA